MKAAKITSHAEFRRALSTPGAVVETVEHWRPERQPGELRPVVRANTVDAYLATDGRASALSYGKASQWQFDGEVARYITHVPSMAFRVWLPDASA